MNCPRCAAEIAAKSRFCPSCGSAVSSSATSATTIAIATSSTPSDFEEGRFLPGTLLADRYRILGRLGKGGMGEVYRATDLRLGQTVALKFLPETTAQDPAMLARFYNEVRIARQVTHPNVCRVYDIGEVDGQVFISMQFIDGDNLASLLLRIGRLPADKAIEISRKLCAGLAAAHSQGVLHRDLKPANIMIDGRGQVLITDFGLASLAEEVRGADIHSGTPAYMAPEQLIGKEVSIKSDLYSLGLVMYEMFTGRRAFEAETLAELVRLREESRPAEISSTVREVDPAIERVIMRCLDPDPAKRPASALAISAALPGGDPLAAALAAGETPSPEMVAAAGAQEGIRPAVAIALLASNFIALGAIVYLNSNQMLTSKMNFEMPPEALAIEARKTVQQFGYTGPVVDRAFTFDYDGSYLQYLRDHHNQSQDWSAIANGRPPLIYFSYRESPRPLEPHNFDLKGRVGWDDPPMNISGMTRVTLDPSGRLLSLTAIPPQYDASATPSQPPDPEPLFHAAGLDLKSFQPVAPEWTQLAASDARAAWTGKLPGHSDPIRVEAAWFHGKPVYFQIVGPWTKPTRMGPGSSHTRGDYVWLVLLMGGAAFAALMAWRNLRLGRGDRQGAFRLAGFAFALNLAEFFLRTHGLVSSWGFDIFTEAVGESLWLGALVWLCYIALEPFVRRRWPQILITWTRVLTGRWRDPLVARDVLIGILVGFGYDLIFAGSTALEMRGGAPPATGTSLDSLLGFSRSLSITLQHVLTGVLASLLFFLLFFVLRLVLRKDWLAGIAFMLFFAIGRGLTGPNPWINFGAALIVYGIVVPMLLRCGLLSLVATIATTDLVMALTFTTNFSAWYSMGSLMLVVFAAGLLLMAFRNALGGRKILAGLLEQ